MAETTEAQRLLTAAEEAAAADDYASAERLLRDAASAQERSLGSSHPDLANTFNNLGVVCERAGKPEDAEHHYRRAYAIARDAFPPDHPFVATSRKNLEDLCEQLGRPFQLAPTAPEPAVAVPEPVSAPEPPGAPSLHGDRPKLQEPAPQGPADTAPLRLQFDSLPSPVTPSPVTPAPAAVPVPPEIAKKHDAVQERSRALPVGVAIVIGISLTIVLIGWIAWPSNSSRDQRETASSTDTGLGQTPVSPPTASTSPAPAPPTPAPAASLPPERSPRESSSNATQGPATIADARLCRTLTTSGAWQCDPVGDPVSSGTIYFYTRVVSPRATQVQHRWYQGDRLRQSVTLDIQANPTGYRTFSRTTVGPDRAGEWRVELRAQDGRVLREERFTVR